MLPVIVLLGVMVGCDPQSKLPPAITQAEADVGGQLLRYKMPEGQLLRYSMNFRFSKQGAGRIDDRLVAEIRKTVLSAGSSEEGVGYNRVNIVRKEIQRNKREVDRRGRKLPPVTAIRTVEPFISPNYGYDAAHNKNYFPVTNRGIFGILDFKPGRSGDIKGQKAPVEPYHRTYYDAAVYLLPILPPKKIKAGSRWVVEMPVYAGELFFRAEKEYRQGNDFPLVFRGGIEKVYQVDGHTMVRLSWTATGSFDTQAYLENYSPRFHERQRMIQELKCSGRALFDATAGLMISKNGKIETTLTTRVKISKHDRQGHVKSRDWVESVERHLAHFDCRLLADGERVTGGR